MNIPSAKITETELAQELSDILNRVEHRGERFDIEREGELIATIGPAGPEAWPTMQEIADQLKDVPIPRDGFGDDLADIRAHRPIAKYISWPT